MKKRQHSRDFGWTFSTTATGRFAGSRLWQSNDETYFFERLYEASRKFQEQDRIDGAMEACKAVALFIKARLDVPYLAIPFLEIAMAFQSLKGRGTPNLFSKKYAIPKERGQSPEEKHAQLFAVALIEAISSHEKVDLPQAAKRVAGAATKWPTLKARTELEGKTILAWRRKLFERKDPREIAQINAIVRDLDKKAKRASFLRSGPPAFKM